MSEFLKKILFVIPPYFDENDYLQDATMNSLPAFSVPYGVLSIEAFIRSHSVVRAEIGLIDLNIGALKIFTQEHKYNAVYFSDLVRKSVQQFKPDIVAISSLFNKSYNYIGMITTIVKEESEFILTVIGGGLATNLYARILDEFSKVDAVCYGEGEIPMTELDDYNSRSYFFDLANRSIKEKKER